jgi:hypothetical protein
MSLEEKYHSGTIFGTNIVVFRLRSIAITFPVSELGKWLIYQQLTGFLLNSYKITRSLNKRLNLGPVGTFLYSCF